MFNVHLKTLSRFRCALCNEINTPERLGCSFRVVAAAAARGMESHSMASTDNASAGRQTAGTESCTGTYTPLLEKNVVNHCSRMLVHNYKAQYEIQVAGTNVEL